MEVAGSNPAAPANATKNECRRTGVLLALLCGESQAAERTLPQLRSRPGSPRQALLQFEVPAGPCTPALSGSMAGRQHIGSRHMGKRFGLHSALPVRKIRRMRDLRLGGTKSSNRQDSIAYRPHRWRLAQ